MLPTKYFKRVWYNFGDGWKFVLKPIDHKELAK